MYLSKVSRNTCADNQAGFLHRLDPATGALHLPYRTGCLLKQVTGNLTCPYYCLKHSTRADIDAHVRFSGMRLTSQSDEAIGIFTHPRSTIQVDLDKRTTYIG